MITRYECPKCQEEFITSTKGFATCPTCGTQIKRIVNPFDYSAKICIHEDQTNFEQMLEVDSKITNLFLEIAEQYGNDMFQFALDRVAEIGEYKNGGE